MTQLVKIRKRPEIVNHGSDIFMMAASCRDADYY